MPLLRKRFCIHNGDGSTLTSVTTRAVKRVQRSSASMDTDALPSMDSPFSLTMITGNKAFWFVIIPNSRDKPTIEKQSALLAVSSNSYTVSFKPKTSFTSRPIGVPSGKM